MVYEAFKVLYVGLGGEGLCRALWKPLQVSIRARGEGL